LSDMRPYDFIDRIITFGFERKELIHNGLPSQPN